MPSDNRISVTMLPADKTAVLAAIATIKTTMPYLLNLTKEERRGLPKLGDKSLAFDEKCAGYMASRPELVPSFVNAAELVKDRVLMNDLNDIAREAFAGGRGD